MWRSVARSLRPGPFEQLPGDVLVARVDEVQERPADDAPGRVAVHQVITDTVDLIGPLAAERALSIHAPSPAECAWTVQADRQRLKQVLLNLASNAVEYNRHGGSISLTCHADDDGRIRIAVADEGEGTTFTVELSLAMEPA